MQRLSTGIQLGLISTLLLASTACRTPQRGLHVSGEAATLSVNLANLDKLDQGRNDLIYELSSCVSALNGVLQGPNVVEFKDPSLKNGLTGCELRIKAVKLSSDIVAVKDTEPGVLYFSKNLAIATDQQGSLVATAGLQKLYVEAPNAQRGIYTLEVPVKFPYPETDKPLTAALVCTPVIANVGVYGAAASSFSFSLPVAGETNYSCSQMSVSVNGTVQKYYGEFPSGIKFKTKADDSSKTSELALQLQSKGGSGSNGIKVDTTGGERCQTTEIFDIDQGKCVAR